MSYFSITNYGAGFSMKLTNGYRISVQFGPSSYCGSYPDSVGVVSMSDWAAGASKRLTHRNNDAEVAIKDPNDDFVNLGGHDSVVGWCTPDQVARMIAALVAGDLDTVIAAARENPAQDQL